MRANAALLNPWGYHINVILESACTYELEDVRMFDLGPNLNFSMESLRKREGGGYYKSDSLST